MRRTLLFLMSVPSCAGDQLSSQRAESCRLVVLLAALAWCASVVAGAPAQLCAAAAEDDPRAARFCQALNTFLELYAEAAGEQVPEYQALVRDYPQLLDTGMKRQDVVHSFLRFGRRR